MKINYPIQDDATYLVACSYGPDSMALLHLLMKETLKIVVCHVNYHKRNISDLEEQSLRNFCVEHNLVFERFEAPKNSRGNFQSWARELRYTFFADMYRKHSAKALFVAHQQDDLIETYLIQKQRRSRVDYYGIEPVISMKKMTIVRPLLSYSKQDLLDYCHENFVPFSIDVSNFETKYLRNKIRLQIVAKLTEIERYQILEEIRGNNEILTKHKQLAKKIVSDNKSLSIPELLTYNEAQFNEAIIQLVKQSQKFTPLSNSQLKEIREMCQSKKPNIDIPLGIGFSLLKEYDTLVLSEQSRIKNYEFILDKPGILSNEYFEIDFSKGAQDRNIAEDDYPLTIRNSRPKDRYLVGGNLCEIRRLFIDWKMPMRLRASWPVVINKTGTIIYVPRYRKNFIDNKKSKFVIKVV
ncbi:MAG: tRNA lysidine(34) synthetase TilS [Bacilli bacterium]|jgi:tRNA(Ile)-lysidine synthase|nr:tRNA lysidine(34) synthetase TilS [Bacilli bacterium]MDD4005751.1 tRNA lysidine(34) synthetase TilS [Bacilli bacterium]